jgi:hypothetical protein
LSPLELEPLNPSITRLNRATTMQPSTSAMIEVTTQAEAEVAETTYSDNRLNELNEDEQAL